MYLRLSNMALLLPFVLLACSNRKNDPMTDTEIKRTISEVKAAYNSLIEHSRKAQLDSFLSFYDNSSDFLSIGADGRMSNYAEFKKACSEYYTSLREQNITTTRQEFQVVDIDHVIVGWTGDIIASLKNGDTIKMTNYSITSVFKKNNEQWKVVHDHESALPPEVIKKQMPKN
jgi:ketosteroid isomerase-like protein